jgi:hypothetical protein
VLCSFGVAHFPRPELALSQIRERHRAGRNRCSMVVGHTRSSPIERHSLRCVQRGESHLPAGCAGGPTRVPLLGRSALSDLLRSAALTDVTVSTFSFDHRLPSADALWKGILHGTVRRAIGIRRQPDDVRARIRAVYDRLLKPYMTDEGVRIPVAFEIGAGRRRLPISTEIRTDGCSSAAFAAGFSNGCYGSKHS